jgi:LemA protein
MQGNLWKIIVVIVAIIAVWFVVTYNRLIAMIEEVKNNNKQIDIQLDRRFKVFQSLIEVVKKYMDYEKSTLKDVVALRNQAQSAKSNGDTQGQMAAENKISAMLPNINMVFEQYPDLKANTNAMQLQEEIVNTENKLAFAKQAYNDSVERYNARRKALLTSMVAGMFASRLNIDFAYWQLDQAKIQEQENYTVKL